MSYNGIEIDMFSLGDADSILVTKWTGEYSRRVLIDGGNANSSEVVQKFLRDRGIWCIEDVVCSHPHDDHAAGLIPLLRDSGVLFGTLWVHVPQNHINLLGYRLGLYRLSQSKRVQKAVKGLETIDELLAVAKSKNVTVREPFAGANIGFMTVCGPSVEYYRELLPEFADLDHLEAEDRESTLPNLDALLELFDGAELSDSLLDDPRTTAENNSSTILATVFDGRKFLFTADAGAQALSRASAAYNLSRCYWMQIPHHGSRRNITAGLINYFAPTVAYVSADGSLKHPRRAVVNAFKKAGAIVYSTHYPSARHLRSHLGVVPVRRDYSAATPLWDADAPKLDFAKLLLGGIGGPGRAVDA